MVDLGVVTFRQAVYEEVRVCEFCGCNDLLACGIGVAEADVVGDGAREEVGVLENDGHVFAQVFLGYVANIDAVDRYAAFLDFVETGEEADYGGFP